MIIPSIDLMQGEAVQFVGGEESPDMVRLGDPLQLLKKFSIAGEVTLVDLDAALEKGSNEELILKMLALAPCRVGGGIRTTRKARAYLDGGAAKVIIGTKAEPAFLKELPPERVIAAIDCANGRVVINGWREKTLYSLKERMEIIRDYVSGFLVTCVEREGRQAGMDMGFLEVLASMGGMDLTLAGGIFKTAEIRRADERGVNTQVGMAFHTGKLLLADAIAAPLRPSDRPDGLWPTVVADERGTVLGLVYSGPDSLRKAVAERKGVYHSRGRGIWVKGAQSGNWQELVSITPDCDRDTLLFTVRQHGEGFCHRRSYSCFGEARGLQALEKRIMQKLQKPEEGSYTRRLASEKGLLKAKLLEEAGELARAKGDEVTAEAADLLYFTMVAMARAGVTLSSVEEELARRALKVTRRPGNAKGRSRGKSTLSLPGNL
ncbi:MAG: phosphoribosyl-ATP diphosphatase [Candidatus Eremiobacteraeota bacterium]|nr:phosphoribosyl-ATP diphosphatase [Candidatus Eremiobacteraeota bacterium]